MSTLKANIVDLTSSTTDFKSFVTANGDKQWVDSYGVIKTNRPTIAENVTIPSGTNGLSTGEITIADGFEVSVDGEWSII